MSDEREHHLSLVIDGNMGRGVPDAEADGYDWPADPAGAMFSAAQTVKATGGRVEIGGVVIEACDQFGRTASQHVTDDESTVAVEAQAAVYGPREGDYGHPREDFTRTAIIWTGLLQHKLADGQFIDADDIARCMIGVKLSRDVHEHKRDNRVDMIGYAVCLDRLETGR